MLMCSFKVVYMRTFIFKFKKKLDSSTVFLIVGQRCSLHHLVLSGVTPSLEEIFTPGVRSQAANTEPRARLVKCCLSLSQTLR